MFFSCFFLEFHYNIAKAWNDPDVGYGEGGPEPQYLESEHNDLSENYDFYVFDSFFKEFNFDKEGSVIYSVYNSGQLLIELCTFYKCSSKSNGGAIYKDFGDCVVYKCCSNKCKGDLGSFLYSSCNDINKLIDSTCAATVKEDSTSEVYLFLGSIEIKKTNISYNNIGDYSALFMSLNKESFVSFVHIANNSADGTNCGIIFSTSNNNKPTTIRNCNIIQNEIPKLTEKGIVRSNNPMKIIDTCIIENNCEYLFVARWEGNLHGKITIINCTLQTKYKTSGTFTLSGKQPDGSSFINHIYGTYKSGYCYTTSLALPIIIKQHPTNNFNIYKYSKPFPKYGLEDFN